MAKRRQPPTGQIRYVVPKGLPPGAYTVTPVSVKLKKGEVVIVLGGIQPIPQAKRPKPRHTRVFDRVKKPRRRVGTAGSPRSFDRIQR